METIKLDCYCSTFGLSQAGVLGPVNRMEMPHKINIHKRGATQVHVEDALGLRPKKIRMLEKMEGQAIAA
jgi:hypothetical protein